MRRLFLLSILASFIISCNYKEGSGNIISENRNVSRFTGLSVSGPFEVVVTTGSSDKVVVEADDNLMDYVETEVNGNLLKIKLKRNFNLRNAHLKAFVSTPGLNKIKASAAADVSLKSGIVSPNKIDLQTSSAASIRGNVDAPNISGSASSGSKLDLTGKSRNLDLSSSSGATIEAYDLLAEYTKASSSSGASIKTFASINLDASASSGGEVAYRGSSKVIRKESSGGSVKKAN